MEDTEYHCSLAFWDDYIYKDQRTNYNYLDDDQAKDKAEKVGGKGSHL